MYRCDGVLKEATWAVTIVKTVPRSQEKKYIAFHSCILPLQNDFCELWVIFKKQKVCNSTYCVDHETNYIIATPSHSVRGNDFVLMPHDRVALFISWFVEKIL